MNNKQLMISKKKMLETELNRLLSGTPVIDISGWVEDLIRVELARLGRELAKDSFAKLNDLNSQ
jgi:hypothetical protein